MGPYPFPFGIKFFFSIHAKTHFFRRCRPSFDSRREPCIVPKKKLNVFCLPTKILSEIHLFFRSFKTVISCANSGSHCLSRKCRTHTFNNFSLAKWESRNGGDLFGRAKIDTVKSCIQLLRIVHYTEDTFTKNCVKGFSDIRRNEKNLL